MKKVVKSFRGVLTGDVLQSEYVMKNLGFLSYVIFFAMVYIAYGYYVDKTMKEVAEMERGAEELGAELHSTLRELNYVSLQSSVAKNTESLGLKELNDAPKFIVKGIKEE